MPARKSTNGNAKAKSAQKAFYITTAIDYTNGSPHLGHAYEKVLTDAISRFQRMDGREVYFLTGVDQHGTKVKQAAEAEGVSPQEFADASTAQFLALWETLEVSYDGWAATTDPRHIRQVQTALQKLFDQGDIYKDTYSGYYSVRQEQFLTEKERGPDGEFGAEWGTVELIEEDNYYFRLTKYADWLVELLKSRKDLVFPEFRQKELLNAAEKLERDLCISRPKERLDWGIELPFDNDYVAYVWFDALMNYVTFVGYLAGETGENDLPEFWDLWPADWHVIGKDILVPAHGIYWLIMLHALGFSDEQIPRLLVHGFWNAEGGVKMSKSLGNVIDPKAMVDAHGPDALRYYLLRAGATGQDADFSKSGFEERYNAELANGPGNLLNRTLNMTHRYREGKLVEPTVYDDEPCQKLRESAARESNAYVQHCRELNFHLGLEAVARLSTAADAFAETQAPWKLAKQDGAGEQLDATLYHLAESARLIAICLSPVVPRAARAMLEQLQWKPQGEAKGQSPDGLNFTLHLKWGLLSDGHEVAKPSPVFPRIETSDQEQS